MARDAVPHSTRPRCVDDTSEIVERIVQPSCIEEGVWATKTCEWAGVERFAKGGANAGGGGSWWGVFGGRRKKKGLCVDSSIVS